MATIDDMNRELGVAVAEIRALARSVGEHRQETHEALRTAAEARGKICSRVDQISDHVRGLEAQVSGVRSQIISYEPDMKRCRMFRHAGIVGGMMLATAVSLSMVWDKLKAAIIGGGT